jgi:UDP-N-acetylmuramoyl-tripeptide--D-alanyl-D-alanine ligase
VGAAEQWSSGAAVTRPAIPLLDSRFVVKTLGEMLRGQGGSERVFTRAVINSQVTHERDLFVALPGERSDGHLYAAAAVAAGASGCVLGHIVEGTETAARFYVDDPLTALQRLGAAWRTALPDLVVVGVTGNVGKTTTKLITAQLLGVRYRTQANEQNYNNEIGVPLCLLELQTTTERSVIEMGMYTRGEIALLCEWARPRTGIVLNVGPVHLERAGSIEKIALAKRELVEALPVDGHAILNADDAVVREMAGHTDAEVTFFGSDERADVRGVEVESRGASGFTFTLEVHEQRRRLAVPLPGTHLLSNVLAGIAAALVEGVTLDEVCEATEQLAVPLRLAVSEMPGGITLLDDTYNANPASMRAALDLLAEMPGRHVALLGDMLELGSETESAHASVGKLAAQEVEVLLTIGQLGSRIAEVARESGASDVTHLGTKDDAVRTLAERLRPGDVLLVKASNVLHLETVVRDLRGELEVGKASDSSIDTSGETA